MSSLQHLVVPGQVIAVSDGDPSSADSFLRGHGTYLETVEETGQQRLVASVTGIIQRVNKLISVESVGSHIYPGHVGDLVVGRIVNVGPTRWSVALQPPTGGSSAQQRLASLPLSGVHLPGGIQRVRTSQDAREMRQFLAPGDLVCAEVHKVQPDGSLQLHTRSLERYGKLENGVCTFVPPALIPRRKNHAITMLDDNTEVGNDSSGVQVLLGCNGMVWLQRKIPESTTGGNFVGGPELAELLEKKRNDHRDLPYSREDRIQLARLRNAVECLRLTHALVTPESIQHVYHNSIALSTQPSEMVHPANVIRLTEELRAR